MRAISSAGLILFLFIVWTACGSDIPETEEGAWLGEGTFFASAGNQEMKAQLELLSDGTYRFLILEPKVLMMVGVEKGTWAREGDEINLSPQNDQSGGGGILSGAPKNFRPKTLTIKSDYSSISLEDDQIILDFEPNPEATKKLRASGEVN